MDGADGTPVVVDCHEQGGGTPASESMDSFIVANGAAGNSNISKETPSEVNSLLEHSRIDEFATDTKAGTNFASGDSVGLSTPMSVSMSPSTIDPSLGGGTVLPLGHSAGSECANGGKADGLWTAELSIAKARAPVKSEFLTLGAAIRVLAPNGVVVGAGPNSGRGDGNSKSRVPEKKSKRQIKRERLLAKRSLEGICSVVARTGDVKQCPYGEKCLFNHDLQGYKAQKPPDLPGQCPSLDTGEPCSYGIACRFAGTHKEGEGQFLCNERRSNTASNEQNSLSKELQKLLWKNNGSYPRADAQLQAMGLMNKAFKMRTASGDDNQVPGPGSLGREESDMGSRKGADGAIKDSSASNMINVNGNITQKQEGGENMSGVASTLMSTVEEGGWSSSLNGDMESGSPPEKKLRVSGSEINGESCDHSDTTNQGNGTLEATNEKINSNLSKDGWQTLYSESKLGLREKKIIDFREKLYLAPLTTVGNLPFRRVCKGMGADITCGEMAMCTNLLQGQASEWALLRRHSSEDVFGVQICGSFPDHVARTAELIENECAVDFIDINMGCPIDLIVGKGAGSCLLTKPQRLEQLVRVTAAVMEKPLTLKVRMGYYEGRNCAHTLVPKLSEWGVSAVTIHGRTRQQRYSKLADWAYVRQCADAAAKGNLQVIGNGDIFSYTDWTEHLKSGGSNLSTCMIARGALIKPWLFREIKEARHWDISSGERLDILKQYVNCGLAHWGSDTKGVETTRHFLLEWLSYMHRYIPVGLLEVVPQRLNWRPPGYFGRNDLETMMASDSAADWVRITELLLGPTPADFTFNPKHKSNAYDRAENG